ncbi:MAG: MATE family efflux transporter [Treponema sp.]|jgi:putative MATE family efflux protein|nr:MATE family efflux transporter [Treponema sp.]
MMEKWNSRALTRMLLPLIVEQALAVTMGAADTVMMSSVGEFAISGVNIVDNINNLLIIAFVAMCTGGAVVVSQYIGRKDTKNAGLAAKQLIYAVTVISLLVMAVALLLRRPIVRLLYGVLAPEVMEAAAIYFLITALSYPFLAIYNANAALFRSVGNSIITMRIAILVNVINVAGNAFLIFVCHMGVTGAAISTFTSRFLAALITLWLLVRGHGRPIVIHRLFKIRFIRSMLRNILNVGVPSGLESSMFQLGRLLTQRILPTFGTAAIAANAVASIINSFSFMAGTAYGIALLTIVGQCVGAGDFDAAKKQTARIMKLAYATMFVISGLILIFAEQVVSLFSLSGEARNMAKTFLQVHSISMMLGWPMSFALPNALRAAGDARYVMVVATISMWTIRVSAAYVLSYWVGLGPVGVWLAMGGDFVGRGVSYFARWKSGRWMEKKVIRD